MKRSLADLLGVLLFVSVVAALLGSCGEEGAEGPMGSPGKPGSPQPIKLLLVGSETGPSLLEEFAIQAISSGVFPMGTVVDYLNAADSVPPLDVLEPYDAVLVWGGNAPFQDRVATGDHLADYVDAGGGVVIATYAFKTAPPNASLGGRFMTPGYSPLLNVGSTSAHSGELDVLSLSVPLHTIFNGTDVSRFTYWENANYSNPLVNIGAILLAMDRNGNNLVAINPEETCVGITMYPPFQFTLSPPYGGPMQLFANACLVVAGAVGN